MQRKLLSLLVVLLGTLALYWVISMPRGLSLGKGQGATILSETSQPQSSLSDQWWLQSGGVLTQDGNVWKTMHGALPPDDPWRKVYLRKNPLDTDGGYYPQNIFRLLSKSHPTDTTQELYFIIDEDRVSRSPNRNASSGVFIISRYTDANNFYQLGIEVSGKAVIKKKYNGLFYVLAENNVWQYESNTYDENSRKSILPQDTRLGIKTELNETSNGLQIKLYVDQGNGLVLAAETTDEGSLYGPILTKGRFGIRSDFMDISFYNYLLDNVSVLSQAAN